MLLKIFIIFSITIINPLINAEKYPVVLWHGMGKEDTNKF